jgi:selenide,water dikinase
VYRLTDDIALVTTADYFTPIVDGAFEFGAIAAANALSDVYAMGAHPVFALNIVGFPRDTLPLTVLTDILRGGAEKAAEAGISIIGGHSIDDREPKYGLAVTGTVHPDAIVRNIGAQPGDVLFLTKPIGTGILTTAIKRRLAAPEDIADALAIMTTLNDAAASAMIEVGVHAATDVTGFGLLGHLSEMTIGSAVGARVSAAAVPRLPSVEELLQRDVFPGGTTRNQEAIEPYMAWDDDIGPTTRLLLADPQTSGGLLIAVAPERADALEHALHARGTPVAARIGEIVAGDRLQVVA